MLCRNNDFINVTQLMDEKTAGSCRNLLKSELMKEDNLTLYLGDDETLSTSSGQSRHSHAISPRLNGTSVDFSS